MTKIVSDNRIAAFVSDNTLYTFSASSQESVAVHVRLFFRRAYKQLSDWKSWDDPDIVMAEERILVE